jgi:hypothetical protein
MLLFVAGAKRMLATIWTNLFSGFGVDKILEAR